MMIGKSVKTFTAPITQNYSFLLF